MFKKIIQVYKKEGLSLLLQRISAHKLMPKWLFCMSVVNIYKLDKFNNNSIRRPLVGYSACDLAENNVKDLVEITSDTSDKLLLKMFNAFLNERAVCCLIKKNSDIAAYNWCFYNRYIITFDNYKTKNVTVNLGEKQVFFGNGYVKEDYRMKGIFPHLLHYSIQSSPEFAEIFSSTQEINTQSNLSHKRIGFIEYAKVMCVHFIGITKYFYKIVHKENGEWHKLDSPILFLYELA